MKIKAYIHSLKDKANNRHVLGEAALAITCTLPSITAFCVRQSLITSLAHTLSMMCTVFRILRPMCNLANHDKGSLRKFKVTITETLALTVEVEADNQPQAEQIVSDAWRKSEYILGSDNFVGVNFETSPIIGLK